MINKQTSSELCTSRSLRMQHRFNDPMDYPGTAVPQSWSRLGDLVSRTQPAVDMRSTSSPTRTTQEVFYNQGSIFGSPSDSRTCCYCEGRCGYHEGCIQQKPEHTIVTLITMAIRDSPQGQATTGQIYQYIMERYPYYRNCRRDWRGSVRSSLQLNMAFNPHGSAEWRLTDAKYDLIYEENNEKKRKSTGDERMEESEEEDGLSFNLSRSFKKLRVSAGMRADTVAVIC